MPKQAKNIKRIHLEYLAWKSFLDIAKGLTVDNFLTLRNKVGWTSKVVLSMVSNEKYKGDALLQKSFIDDCISKNT